MNVVPFDFSRPPLTSFEDKVSGWLTAACALTARQWPGIVNCPAQLRLVKIESTAVANVLQRLADETPCFHLQLADEGAFFVSLPRPVYLAMIAGSLGEPVTDQLVDRPMTAIEDDLGQLLLRKMLLAPLQEAWPLASSLPMAIVKSGPPRKVCPLPISDIVLAVSFVIEGPFGEQPLDVLLPRFGPLRQLALPECGADQQEKDRALIRELIHEMPTEFSVVLGTAEVPLSRLANLVEGDLLVLDQRVEQPLIARIESTDKFRVWPGLIRRRQAVRIDATVNK